jgi:hypothetical protein
MHEVKRRYMISIREVAVGEMGGGGGRWKGEKERGGVSGRGERGRG